MLEMAKSILEKERKGSMTFEWTITCPVLLGLLFICIFMLMLSLSYANYGALAGDMASSMNFRQTGIQNAKAANPSAKKIQVGKVKNDLSPSGSWNTFSWNNIKMNGGSSASGVGLVARYYFLQNANKVYFPFAKLDKVYVDTFRMENGKVVTYKPTTSSATAANYANMLVKVDVKYQFMPMNILGWTWKGLDIHSVGYSVLT